MQITLHRFLRATPLLLFLIIAGCALGPSAPSPQELAKAEALAAQNNNLAAAELYQELGERAAGEAHAKLFIKAAEQYRRAMFPEKATALLQSLNQRALPPALRIDYAVVAARLDLQAGNPRQALERVDFASATLPTEQQRDVLAVRGRALFALGAPMDATRLLLQRAALLTTDAASRLDNQRLIWQGLSQARESLSAAGIPDDGKGRLLSGWIQLGAIGQSAWENPEALPAQLDQWARRYSNHPANRFLLAEIRADFIRRFQYPAQLALLLPLSGSYALQAEAVRDGFLAARYHSAANNLPTVRIYDTGGTPTGVLDAFRQARSNGAQFIIGPLTKEGLQVLANLPSRDVPLLGLNYLEVPAGAKPQPQNLLYQFGLLPEDEARQAAKRAIADGHTRGVALVPANEWGRRMLLAFKSRFEKLGGTLLDGQSYPPVQNDYSTAIMRVMNLDASQMRYQTLRSTLNLDIHFEPRRRQDVEFVFIAAQPRAAKLLRPQLKFYRAIDLPVYATSHVYELDGQADHDLDGIRFADMPWSISPDSDSSELRQTIKNLWPVRYARAGRLYALGFDAYRLIPLLANHAANPLPRPVPGLTGVLSMDKALRIHRDLSWAVFEDGEPELLAPPARELSRQAEEPLAANTHAGQN